MTPLVGRHVQTRETTYWWNKMHAHPRNWTKENIEFCVNAALDIILKSQRTSAGYGLVNYIEVYEDVITPVGNEAVFYDAPSHALMYPPLGTQGEKKPVLILNRGCQLIGYASDSQENLEEWGVISYDLPNIKDFPGLAFVKKDAVRVASVGVEEPKRIPDFALKPGRTP